MRAVIASVCVLCGFASAAAAQSTFVSGSLVGELARFGYVEPGPLPYGDLLDTSVDGETVGFGVSLERALGERWGVALEFARPGTVTREQRQELPVSIAIFPPLPPITIEREVEHRRMSWNTMAWLSQDVGDRVELAFSAGVSFTRTKYRDTYDVAVPALVLLAPGVISAGPSRSVIEYGVDPVVGLDARLRFSDSFSIVPGIRFQSGGLGGRRGWLLRPGIGARWGF